MEPLETLERRLRDVHCFQSGTLNDFKSVFSNVFKYFEGEMKRLHINGAVMEMVTRPSAEDPHWTIFTRGPSLDDH